MQGDDRVRHCSMCRKNVYNLSNMTLNEAREIVARPGGSCVTFFQREDGTVLTEDCPVGLALVRRKVKKLVVRSASAAAMLVASIALGAKYDPSRTVEAQARELPGVASLLKWLSPPRPPPPAEPPPRTFQFTGATQARVH
jgi:hypothetical protein